MKLFPGFGGIVFNCTFAQIKEASEGNGSVPFFNLKAGQWLAGRRPPLVKSGPAVRRSSKSYGE